MVVSSTILPIEGMLGADSGEFVEHGLIEGKYKSA